MEQMMEDVQPAVCVVRSKRHGRKAREVTEEVTLRQHKICQPDLIPSSTTALSRQDLYPGLF